MLFNQRRKALQPFDAFRQFNAAEVVFDEEATEYVDRAYLPWAKEHYGSWMSEYQHSPMMTHNATAQAFLNYAGWGYLHPDTQREDLMSAEFVKDVALIPDDIVVHRLTSIDELESLAQLNNTNLKKDAVLRIPYFWSTSLIESYLQEEYRNITDKNVMLHIYLPAGTRGLFMDFISHRFQEQEMLLDKGLTIRIIWQDRATTTSKRQIYATVSVIKA